MLGVVGSNLTMVKFEPTTPNMSQHIATRWPNARNMLRPTLLRNVALACCNRLAGALNKMKRKEIVVTKTCRIIKQPETAEHTYFIYVTIYSFSSKHEFFKFSTVDTISTSFDFHFFDFLVKESQMCIVCVYACFDPLSHQ